METAKLNKQKMHGGFEDEQNKLAGTEVAWVVLGMGQGDGGYGVGRTVTSGVWAGTQQSSAWACVHT